MDFTIENPTKKDIPEILRMIYPEYFKESFISEGMNYDEENTTSLISSCIDGICFVAKTEGKIIAFCAMAIYKTFYKELLGEVPFFFITPQCRGTKISRTFVEHLLDARQRNNVKKMMITASSKNPESNKRVENLWKKFGFDARHGLTMMKGF